MLNLNDVNLEAILDPGNLFLFTDPIKHADQFRKSKHCKSLRVIRAYIKRETCSLKVVTFPQNLE